MPVVQLNAPCWVIEGASYYGRPHFHERKDAIDVVGEYGASAYVERNDAPCWVVKCSICGEVAEIADVDYDELHHTSETEAENTAAALDDDHCEHPDECQCAVCLYEHADLPTGP